MVRRFAVWLVVTVFVAVASVGCAKDPLRPYPGEPAPPFVPYIDNDPVWSHDGRWIAYRRGFPSSDGPAGLYIIAAEGGDPRFLAAGDFFSPTYMRFSPDDRYISCTRGWQLLVVDLQTGELLEPLYTPHGVLSPDWSPEGRSIAYSRFVSEADSPPESLGLYVFDMVTGTDTPVSYQGEVQFGRFPVWSEDSRNLAMVQPVSEATVPFHFRISILSSDGTALTSLVESPPGIGGLSNLRRYVRRARGLDGLAFSGLTPLGQGSFFVNWDGSGLQLLPLNHLLDAYSPDGSLGVGARYNPKDSLVVLFTFSTDDISGATYRQLTFYEPPVTTPTRMAPTKRAAGVVSLTR